MRLFIRCMLWQWTIGTKFLAHTGIMMEGRATVPGIAHSIKTYEHHPNYIMIFAHNFEGYIIHSAGGRDPPIIYFWWTLDLQLS
jgi:hypothetical protein